MNQGRGVWEQPFGDLKDLRGVLEAEAINKPLSFTATFSGSRQTANLLCSLFKGSLGEEYMGVKSWDAVILGSMWASCYQLQFRGRVEMDGWSV